MSALDVSTMKEPVTVSITLAPITLAPITRSTAGWMRPERHVV